MHATRTLALTALILVAGALPALAQPNAVASPGARDRAFVTTMLQTSRGQLALAQLAHRRAVGFIAASAALQTAQEWALLRARLIPLAYAVGAPVRGTLTSEQRAQLFHLGRIFAEEQTADPAVLAFATYAQPVVESYQQMTADDMKDHPGT
jgi:hypothetical protein